MILIVVFITSSALANNDNTSNVNTLPYLQVVVTGDLRGAVVSCKCPHGQPGGLARRKAILDILNRAPLNKERRLLIEVGRLTHADMDSIQTKLAIELLKRLNYKFINCYLIDVHILINNLKDDEPDCLSALPLGFQYFQQFGHYDGDYWSATIDESSISRQNIIYNSNSFPYTIISQTSNDEFPGDPVNIEIPYKDKTYKYNIPDFCSASEDHFFDVQGLGILARNVVEDSSGNIWQAIFPSNISSWPTALNLLLIGGSGFIDPQVSEYSLGEISRLTERPCPADSSRKILTVFPGTYGEFVTVVNLWINEDFTVKKWEWEAIPTDSVAPDREFEELIKASIPRKTQP